MEHVIASAHPLDNVESALWDILKNIVIEYDQLPKEQQSSIEWITDRILNEIGIYGVEKQDCEVVSKNHMCAWLYDLVLYRNNEEGFLVDTFLVLESELSSRRLPDLRYDFEKLLASNSIYKVFICFGQGNYNYPGSINNIIEYLEKSVQANRQLTKDSRILLLIWSDYCTGEVHPYLMIK